MGEGTELIEVSSLNIPALMETGEGLEAQLKDIEARAWENAPRSVETPKDRATLRSYSMKIVHTRKYIEGKKKEGAADLKARVKQVDVNWRITKDRLLLLQSDIRDPLTTWEKEDKERKEAEALEKQIDSDWDEALAEDIQFNQARELEKQQAELNERIRLQEEKEAEARRAQERMEREARIRQKAIDDAARKVEKQRIREKVEAERKIQEAEEAKIRARIDKEKAEQKLEAEKKRLEDIEELNRLTKERLEKEKLEAIAEERRKVIAYADEVEKKRVADAQRLSDLDAERAQDELHRVEVFNAAVDALVEAGNNQYMVTLILRKIEAGEVPNIQFIY
ncbi:MAG: hypothetical protein GY757_19155 [bacterium]|nr:hypothetical protein [bacterium]